MVKKKKNNLKKFLNMTEGSCLKTSTFHYTNTCYKQQSIY